VSQFWAWVEDLAESGPYELCSEEARHAASRRLQVLPPVGLEQAISDCEAGMALYYGDREADRADFELSSGRIFIGPEAGFTSDERGALQAAGASALRLGPYNLRIETAAVAAMVVFNVTGTRDPKASL